MATEVEYVNYKDFVADLESTENPGVDDVTVVSNRSDGPRTIPANTYALTNTATDSDLTAAASFELQTATGKKKVPANLLSKQSALETTNSNVTALTTYAQNVAHSIAPEFDPTRNYVVDDSCTYEGTVYIFTSNHPAGAWNPAHATISGQNALLRLTAQNALAGNVAPAFDPTRTSENPYLVGDRVIYEGKYYRFINSHYGAWSNSDVVRINVTEASCGLAVTIPTGANVAHIDLSYTGQIVFAFRGTESYTYVSGILIVNRRGQGSESIHLCIKNGNYELANKFKLYVDTNGNSVIRNVSGHDIAVSVIAYTDKWTLGNGSAANWDEASKTEFGSFVEIADKNYVASSISSAADNYPYGLDINANENICKMDLTYTGNVVFTYMDATDTGNYGTALVNKKGLGDETHIVVITDSENPFAVPFKVYKDSGNRVVVRNTSGHVLRVKILSATSRFDLVRTNAANWDEASKTEFGKWFYIKNSQVIDSVDTFAVESGDNVAIMDFNYTGQIVLSYRMTGSYTKTNGILIVNKVGVGDNTRILQLADNSSDNLDCPLKLYYAGAQNSCVIRNVSEVSVDIKIISKTERWNVSTSSPSGWDEASKTEFGKWYKVGESNGNVATLANIHSLKYVVNASRYNKDGNNKHDFTYCIVTDSHHDWKSVNNAIDITSGFKPIDICLHCGDVGNDISYGTTSLDGWNSAVARAIKPLYFVVGNHEAGTYPNIGLTPTQENLYDIFIAPLVAKGWLVSGDYESGKCYYFHDFDSQKIRLVVLNEFEAPMDIDATYWEPVTYDDTKPAIASNTDYAVDDIVNVSGYTSYSFKCKSSLNTGVYYSGYWPKYKILRKMRWFTKSQLDWFASKLLSTPEGYSVVVAVHQPLSPNSKNQSSMMFGDTQYGNNSPGGHIQSVMSGDVLADMIDAFKTKGTFSATIEGIGTGAYIDSFSVSYDFTDANDITNVMAVGGHAHRDLLWKHDTYTYLYDVTPTTSCTTSNDNYKISNEMRLKTTESDYACDCLTCISFGHQNRIALTKIGVDVDIDAKFRNFQVIDNS